MSTALAIVAARMVATQSYPTQGETADVMKAEFVKGCSYPTRHLLNPTFVYTSAANTDIRKTWAKHGWEPKGK